MRSNFRPTCCAAALAAIVAMPLASAHAQSVSQLVGLDDLIARLGSGNQPTGLNQVVAQVEAPSGGAYGPDQSLPEFAGKTFTPMSGPLGVSWHATTVGQNMYGLNAIAPDINIIFNYEVNDWLNGHLNLGGGAGVEPAVVPPGVKSINNSWVGQFGNASLDNEVLRRADFLITRDQVILTNGVQNAPNPQLALMTYGYNGISVGLMSGSHTFGNTPATVDGPGRMKPEIVAPGQFTSFSTPIVNAAAALMIETARTEPALVSNPNAERSEVVKAVLLAGANHRPGWTNNPVTTGILRGLTATPLDPVYGVDLLNVNNSHLILTGMEQNGATSPPASANIGPRGWDLEPYGTGASRYYRFHLNAEADQISILVTWHRIVSNTFGVPIVPNLAVFLWRVDSNNQLVTLIGTAGEGWFDSGNVVSQSAVDNLEHIFVRGLEAGSYAIEVRRQDQSGGMASAALAWLIPPTFAIGDTNQDGLVNVVDLLAVIGAWGACPVGPCPADVNGDGQVDVTDLLLVINNWSP